MAIEINVEGMKTAIQNIVNKATEINTCMSKMSRDFESLKTSWSSDRFVTDLANPYNKAVPEINKFLKVLIEELPNNLNINYGNITAWDTGSRDSVQLLKSITTVQAMATDIEKGVIKVDWTKTLTSAEDANTQMGTVDRDAKGIIQDIGSFTWDAPNSADIKKDLTSAATKVAEEFVGLTATMNNIINQAKAELTTALNAGAGKQA